MREFKAPAPRFNPFLVIGAVLALAFFTRQSYRLLRSEEKRPRYKSQSRRPQIARWESEGGMVPEVRSVQSQSTH